jgi:hypothetical protein
MMNGRGIAILEDLFGVNAIDGTLFSDFPDIVLIEALEDVSEVDWPGTLRDFQARYLGEPLFARFDKPLRDFGRDRIVGPLKSDYVFDRASLPELRRLMERYRHPMLIFAREYEAQRRLPDPASLSSADLPNPAN